jgi:hypothetical protein
MLIPSCSLFSFGNKSDVIAEVNKNQLLASDIILLIPPGLPREDSLSMLRRYVNSWALAHLMEAKAQKELPKELRDMSRAIDEYRRSLLVFQYEKSYIEMNIDTTITMAELRKVYKDNEALFMLSEPIVKVRYIKIMLSSPHVELVRSLYRSQGETYQLEQMAQHSFDTYNIYNNQWISISTLSKDLPISSDEVVSSLHRGGLECSDHYYAFFVTFLDHTPAGTLGPFEYEETTIKNIIIGRRKQELLKKLESKVLDEGWRTKQLKIYEHE